MANLKVVKTSLLSLVHHPSTIEKLQDVALTIHKIASHTYQFIKLYFLHLKDHHLPFPRLSKQWLVIVMKMFCDPPKTGRKPSESSQEIKNELLNFYQQFYRPLQLDQLSYLRLNTVLDYLAITILTSYENNIKAHFVNYITRYINVRWKKKEFLAGNHTSKEKEEFLAHLKRIKNDFLTDSDEVTSQPEMNLIVEIKDKIFPHRQWQKKSLFYDLAVSPQDYLQGMLWMMRKIEKKEEKIKQVFPLRHTFIPQYFILDTTSIVHILLSKEQEGNKGFYLGKGNLVENEEKLWNFFFKLQKKIFRPRGYQFHHMIMTDGLACSVILRKREGEEKEEKSDGEEEETKEECTHKTKTGRSCHKLVKREQLCQTHYHGKHQVKKKKEEKKDDPGEKYLTELSEEERIILKEKKAIVIDPNKGDLIYCLNQEKQTFRYTQNQRRKEMKSKKYRQILAKERRTVVQGKSIRTWETELSLHNKKTLVFSKFLQYLKIKNYLHSILGGFYQQRIWRKLRWGKYINQQKSEQKMLNNFKKIMGPPESSVIYFGDWDQQRLAKYHEPSKGKSFRDLFRRWGYLVYLLDEFRTSARCSACQGECQTFLHCFNPRPWKQGERMIRHGLVRCTTCQSLWNRDYNATRNQMVIVQAELAGKGRPEYLSRKKDPKDRSVA